VPAADGLVGTFAGEPRCACPPFKTPPTDAARDECFVLCRPCAVSFLTVPEMCREVPGKRCGKRRKWLIYIGFSRRNRSHNHLVPTTSSWSTPIQIEAFRREAKFTGFTKSNHMEQVAKSRLLLGVLLDSAAHSRESSRRRSPTVQVIPKTIDHSTLQRLIGAGANVAAEVIAHAGGWGVVINYERARQTLAATRGKPRTFRQFETLAGYLKALGIVEYRVNASAFEPGNPAAGAGNERSLAASTRMKLTHQAAAYDTWFRGQVQASIDDPRPGVDSAIASAQFAAKRDALIQRQTSVKLPKVSKKDEH
jgi:hypothetical protein